MWRRRRLRRLQSGVSERGLRGHQLGRGAAAAAPCCFIIASQCSLHLPSAIAFLHSSIILAWSWPCWTSDLPMLRVPRMRVTRRRCLAKGRNGQD